MRAALALLVLALAGCTTAEQWTAAWSSVRVGLYQGTGSSDWSRGGKDGFDSEHTGIEVSLEPLRGFAPPTRVVIENWSPALAAPIAEAAAQPTEAPGLADAPGTIPATPHRYECGKCVLCGAALQTPAPR